jgi:hypothetical protein
VEQGGVKEGGRHESDASSCSGAVMQQEVSGEESVADTEDNGRELSGDTGVDAGIKSSIGRDIGSKINLRSKWEGMRWLLPLPLLLAPDPEFPFPLARPN